MTAFVVKYEAEWDGTSVTISARVVSAEFGNIYGAVPIEKFPCPKVLDVDSTLEYRGYQATGQISAGVPFDIVKVGEGHG